MEQKAERRHHLPRASAELTGHMMMGSNDIFVSSTITLDFSHINSVEVTNTSTEPSTVTNLSKGVTGDHPVLLLTLSPLHHIHRVRVLLSSSCEEGGNRSDNSESGSDPPVTWHDLRLCEQTLYPTDRATLQAKHHEAHPYSTPCVAEECSVEGVMELDITSDHGGGTGAEDDDEFARLFAIELMLSMVSEVTMGEVEALRIVKCCVDVELVAVLQLPRVVHPRFIVFSRDGKGQCFTDAVIDGGDDGSYNEDDYILFIGQRQYDYYICPRIEYVDGNAVGDGFVSINVDVTKINRLRGGESGPWEAVPLSPLPVQPADVLCAFVRPLRDGNDSVAVEEHNGTRWRVQHHHSYTHMKIEQTEVSAANRPCLSMYFFHCDHMSCECILRLVHIAELAWTSAMKREYAADGTTWVVARASGSSPLLSARRGVLCTRHAVLLSDDTLCWATGVHSTVSSAVALRGEVAVLSAALELGWHSLSRDVACFSGLLGVRDGCFTILCAAILRAWSMCLLSGEPGWTEFLRQERQVILYGVPSATSSQNSWCLPQRYLREVYISLLLLSSPFVVNALRRSLCSPWELLQGRSTLTSVQGSGALCVSPSSGMHLSLVKYLIQADTRERWCSFDATPPSIIRFVGTLTYEEKLPAKALTEGSVYGSRNVLLHIRVQHNGVHVPSLRFFDNQPSDDAMWLVGIPFTVLYFAVDCGSLHSSGYVGTSSSAVVLPPCRVMCTLPCYWRVCALDWARGVSQHSCFTLLGPFVESTGVDVVGKRCKPSLDIEGNTDSGEKQAKSPPLLIPFVVLNPKVVPAALLLYVEHKQLLEDLSESTGFIARQAVLQRIMDESVREEAEGVEEVDWLYTPLLNQLLLNISNAVCCNAPTCTAAPPPIQLFKTALQAANSNFEAVWRRIYTDTQVRLLRCATEYGCDLMEGRPLKRPRAVKEWPEYTCGKLSQLEVNMRRHVRTLMSYQSTLPQLQLNPQRRRLLALRLPKQRVNGVACEKSIGGERAGGDLPRSVTDLMQLVCCALGAITRSLGGEVVAPRRAVDSLLLPLWLLLLDLQHSSSVERTERFGIDTARRVFEAVSAHSIVGRLAFPIDTYILKAYELLVPDS